MLYLRKCSLYLSLWFLSVDLTITLGIHQSGVVGNLLSSVGLSYIILLHMNSFARWKSDATLFISAVKESISASYRNIIFIVLSSVIALLYITSVIPSIAFVRSYTVLFFWIIIFSLHCFLNYICLLWYIGNYRKKHENENILKVTHSGIFYQSEINTDTIFFFLHVRKSTALSMHICTHTNKSKPGDIKLGS